MIALLTGWGLSRTVAKLIAYVGIPLLVLAAFYFAISAYGNAREQRGVDKTDAAWKAASDKVVKAQAAGTALADKKELPRVVDFTAKVEAEKVKIDAAEQNGSSPFDVLFPAGNGM